MKRILIVCALVIGLLTAYAVTTYSCGTDGIPCPTPYSPPASPY
jgi:hypothetical protein